MLPELISATASAVALVISIVSLRSTLRLQNLQNRAVLVRTAYAAFNGLSELRIVHPECAHLLSLRENYAHELAVVKRIFDQDDARERARIEMLERAVATRIFELFEETLYEIEIAQSRKDARQVKFQSEVLAYFVQRLLVNPRLAYLWSADVAPLYRYFEESTTAYYKAHVRPAEVDTRGPFNGPPGEAGGT